MKIIVYTQDEFEPAYSLDGVTRIKYDSLNEEFHIWRANTKIDDYACLNLRDRILRDYTNDKNIYKITICTISTEKLIDVIVLTLNIDVIDKECLDVVTECFETTHILIDSQLKRMWVNCKGWEVDVPFLLETMEWVFDEKSELDEVLPCYEYGSKYLIPFRALQIQEAEE